MSIVANVWLLDPLGRPRLSIKNKRNDLVLRVLDVVGNAVGICICDDICQVIISIVTYSMTMI